MGKYVLGCLVILLAAVTAGIIAWIADESDWRWRKK